MSEEWIKQEASIGSFFGYIKTKESVKENGDLFTHVVYSFTNGQCVIAGIGDDVNEVVKRIERDVYDFEETRVQAESERQDSQCDNQETGEE